MLVEGSEPEATSRQGGRGGARQPAAKQAHVERNLRRSTVWLRHVHKPDDGTSGREPISKHTPETPSARPGTPGTARSRDHDQTGAASPDNRCGAPTRDAAVIGSVAPVGGTADATSRREVPGDPIAMLLGLLSLHSRLALCATASMVQLPLRMIAGVADGHRQPRPGEFTTAHAANEDGREPAADPPCSVAATLASPRSSGDDDRHSLSSAHSLAHILRSDGDYQRARRLDENVLARRRRILGDDHPDTLSSAHNLAIDLSALGEHETARTVADDTLARRRRVLGDDHPRTLSSAHNLARILRTLGATEQACRLGEEALAGRRRVLGDDHPRTLSSAHNLAHILRSADDYEHARRLDEDTLARRRRVLGDDHPDTLSSAHNLAIDLSAMGDHETARTVAQDTLARRRRVLDDEHPDILSSADSLTVGR